MSSVLLLITVTALGQEVEYINYDDYYWGCGTTIKTAVEDLKLNINDVVTVATKTKLRNNNGKQDYTSTTGTETFFNIPLSGITIIPMEGYYRAGIEKSKVQHIEGKWVEQNITVNNTYNETPRYSNGFRRDVTVTRTTRRTDVVGPSGKVVKSTPGRGTTTKTRTNWNGRYGYTWKTVENDR